MNAFVKKIATKYFGNKMLKPKSSVNKTDSDYCSGNSLK